MSEARWIVHDPNNQDTDHETEGEALAEAHRRFKEYSDYAESDGWTEEIEYLRVSKVTHSVQQLWFKHKPDDSELDESECDEDGIYWGGGYEIMSDYALLPTTPKEPK